MKIKFFILIGMISLQASFAQEVKDSTLVTREIEKNAEKTQLQLIQLDKDKKAAQEATLQAQKDAEKAVNALFASIEEALVAGDKVQLIGFGTFEVRTREERKGRNPKNGEEITIPASKNPAFKAGKGLKEAVN